MAYDLWTVNNSGVVAHANVASHSHPRGGLLRVSYDDGREQFVSRDARAYKTQRQALAAMQRLGIADDGGIRWSPLGRSAWIRGTDAVFRRGARYALYENLRADYVTSLDRLEDAMKASEEMHEFA